MLNNSYPPAFVSPKHQTYSISIMPVLLVEWSYSMQYKMFHFNLISALFSIWLVTWFSLFFLTNSDSSITQYPKTQKKVYIYTCIKTRTSHIYHCKRTVNHTPVWSCKNGFLLKYDDDFTSRCCISNERNVDGGGEVVFGKCLWKVNEMGLWNNDDVDLMAIMIVCTQRVYKMFGVQLSIFVSHEHWKQSFHYDTSTLLLNNYSGRSSIWRSIHAYIQWTPERRMMGSLFVRGRFVSWWNLLNLQMYVCIYFSIQTSNECLTWKQINIDACYKFMQMEMFQRIIAMSLLMMAYS